MQGMAITKWSKGAAVMLLFFGVSMGVVSSNSGGPPTGSAGVPAGHGLPAEMTCAQSGCHTTFP